MADILEAIETLQIALDGYDEYAKVEIGQDCEQYLFVMGNKYLIPSDSEEAKKLFECARFMSGEWIENSLGDE